ncbi:cyclase family protein [Beduini massiliensis]|uniref:cyclase family protein n=1 Tax=Beduini massiliensis TaxID=1585974 RepID=UPI00059A9FF8|nr:cyclase family protein [Beduini massiliensis]
MYYDLTLKITPKLVNDANQNEKMTLSGHLGTHFDVMNKEFPLDYLRLSAVIFDVSSVYNRDIEIEDIDIDLIQENRFIAFHTGFINAAGYGTPRYFKEHPQLSASLIEALIQKGVNIIGIDCAGIRRGKEHTPMDQHCADHHVFVVENLCQMEMLLNHQKAVHCTINTYPIHYSHTTGLPCRVVAEI